MTMYDAQSLHHLPGEANLELLKETHKALVGLLWLIEDLRNYDESLVESHFDDTTPMERSQYVHRLLMTRTPKNIVDKDFLGGKGKEELRDWCKRCKVVDSFQGADSLLE